VSIANQQASALDAQRSAQEALTRARRDATRQLQDLVLQQEKAALGVRSGEDAINAARRRLQEAIRTGGDVEGAQVALQAAQLDQRGNRTALRRANADLSRAQQKGVEGSDRVVAATRALDAANRNLAQSTS